MLTKRQINVLAYHLRGKDPASVHIRKLDKPHGAIYTEINDAKGYTINHGTIEVNGKNTIW